MNNMGRPLYPPEWNTPLVRLEASSKVYGCDVYGKLEIVNPTGVHKDRESSVVMEDLKSKGYRSLACASSGNAAISISAFAYAMNVEAHIFLGAETPKEKVSLVEAFHPKIHLVRGEYLEAVEALMEFVESKQVYNANAGYCEAKLVGNAYIGAEIARSLRPTVVVCPTNNGTHFVGVARGVLKTMRGGVKPRMVAATAPETQIAHSIKGFYRLEEPKITEVIDETDGRVVEVEDNEIIDATRTLIKQGIIVEPAAAASVAALKQLELNKNDVVCCTITGSGLKYPSLIKEALSGEHKRGVSPG